MTVREKLVKAMSRFCIRKTVSQLAKAARVNANSARRELVQMCRKRKATHKPGGYLLRR
jgi:hypothetical protein